MRYLETKEVVALRAYKSLREKSDSLNVLIIDYVELLPGTEERTNNMNINELTNLMNKLGNKFSVNIDLG